MEADGGAANPPPSLSRPRIKGGEEVLTLSPSLSNYKERECVVNLPLCDFYAPMRGLQPYRASALLIPLKDVLLISFKRGERAELLNLHRSSHGIKQSQPRDNHLFIASNGDTVR